MKFNKRGLLMLDEQAYRDESLALQPPPQLSTANQVAVIPVRGPLENHADCGPFMSYEAIRQLWSQACQDPGVGTIVLDLDTPGGLTSGVFAAVHDMRAQAKAAGKRTVAYAYNALSAGYALAMACDEFYAEPAAMIGSIGVIHPIVDESRSLDAHGISIHLITSGKHKADGHSAQPFSEAAASAIQSTVNAVAELFIGLVAERRGMAAEVVSSFEARQYPGHQAQALGLIDGVLTRDQLIAKISQPQESGKDAKMAMTAEEKEKMLAAISAAVAEGDMTKEEAAAALGLSAEDPKEEDPPPPPSEDDKPEASSALAAQVAAMAGQIAALTQITHGMSAKSAAAELKAEQDALIASRPDFDDATCQVLRAGPIDVLRSAVKNFPIVPGRSRASLAASQAVPTGGGDDPANPQAKLPPAESHALKARMGLVQHQRGISFDGVAQTFGALKGAN